VVITKTPAGKWLSIAAGAALLQKLRQAKDSALPLVALLQNPAGKRLGIASLEMWLWLPKLQQANALALLLVGLLQHSGRQKTRHCHWRHYFKTLAGKRLGIASLEMLWWLLKLQQANDLALPLVALLHNSSRQKTRHSPWRHYFKTLAGKRLGIAT
jgi:hypothetical protein